VTSEASTTSTARVVSAVAILVAPEDTSGSRFSGGNASEAAWGRWGDRGVGRRALCQAAGLVVAVGGSLLAGLLAGTALRLPCLARPPERLCFDNALDFTIQDRDGSSGMVAPPRKEPWL